MKKSVPIILTVAICLALTGCRNNTDENSITHIEPNIANVTAPPVETMETVETNPIETALEQAETKEADPHENEKDAVDDQNAVETEYDLSKIELGENQLPFG